jgi:hypothetical protein
MREAGPASTADERFSTCNFSVMSAYGPSRRFAAAQQFDRFRSEADIKRLAGPVGLVEKRPKGNLGGL